MADSLPKSTQSDHARRGGFDIPEKDAWRALIALCIGFFMILLDQTIVAVATPDIQVDLGANYAGVLWVTSVYLLTFAVPLLVTGRLGDQIGPKKVYLTGMVIFTLSSLACGLSSNIETPPCVRLVVNYLPTRKDTPWPAQPYSSTRQPPHP